MPSYNIGLLTVDDIKKWKAQLQLLMSSNESAKDLVKCHILKEPKLEQLYKVFCGLRQCIPEENL